MIEIQLTLLKYLAAVLTPVAISVEDIAPGEPYFARREAIVANELDHLRNSNRTCWGADDSILGGRRKIAPVLEVVAEEKSQRVALGLLGIFFVGLTIYLYLIIRIHKKAKEL